MKKVFYVAPSINVKSMNVESILAVSPGGGTGNIPGTGHNYGGEDDGTHVPGANERGEWGNLWD